MGILNIIERTEKEVFERTKRPFGISSASHIAIRLWNKSLTDKQRQEILRQHNPYEYHKGKLIPTYCPEKGYTRNGD